MATAYKTPDLLSRGRKCCKEYYWVSSQNWNKIHGRLWKKYYVNIKFPEVYNHTVVIQENIPVLRKYKQVFWGKWS